jgi:hypothetical protein
MIGRRNEWEHYRKLFDMAKEIIGELGFDENTEKLLNFDTI